MSDIMRNDSHNENTKSIDFFLINEGVYLQDEYTFPKHENYQETCY